jgi:hypothetical protein
LERTLNYPSDFTIIGDQTFKEIEVFSQGGSRNEYNPGTRVTVRVTDSNGIESDLFVTKQAAEGLQIDI